MSEALTTQEVLEMGKMWGDNLFSVVPPEEVISHYKPEELLSALPLEEIKAYLQKIEAKPETKQN